MLVILSRRFLRARKFDVQGALDQFHATEQWRAANEIDLLYENIDVESYEESRRVVSLRTWDLCLHFALAVCELTTALEMTLVSSMDRQA